VQKENGYKNASILLYASLILLHDYVVAVFLPLEKATKFLSYNYDIFSNAPYISYTKLSDIIHGSLLIQFV
jgi:hypothetical protein